MSTSLFVLFLLGLVSLAQSQAGCFVCRQCIDCPPDVMTDSNIDEIHALLTKNIQKLGTPLRIRRDANSTVINY
jgi:hypothetical protein